MDAESPPEEELPAEEPRVSDLRLTVADGFRFGCGFLLAGLAFAFILLIAAAALGVAALLVGVPLPFGLP